MLETGDKVVVVAEGNLNGLPGVVAGFSPHIPGGVHVLLDEDAATPYYTLFFFDFELQKVRD